MRTKRFPSARQLTALAICAIAMFTAGCSASFSTGSGTTTIDKPDVVSDMQKFMSQQLTDLPPSKSVDCPGDEPAAVDGAGVGRRAAGVLLGRRHVRSLLPTPS